jgi:hypothetical protein
MDSVTTAPPHSSICIMDMGGVFFCMPQTLAKLRVLRCAPASPMRLRKGWQQPGTPQFVSTTVNASSGLPEPALQSAPMAVKPSPTSASEYSEGSIRVLKGLEPVKQRPGRDAA